MAQRFLGGIFGNTVPSTADQPAISGVYDLNGQYYNILPFLLVQHSLKVYNI